MAASPFLSTLFANTVVYSFRARPVKTGIVWPTAKEGVKESGISGLAHTFKVCVFSSHCPSQTSKVCASRIFHTLKAVGRDVGGRAEPATAGGTKPEKYFCRPWRGFASKRLISQRYRAGPHYVGPDGPRSREH